MDKIQYKIGDVVEMKKKHPCGTDLWTIRRTGMNVGIKCQGCAHFVMLPRVKFQRQVKAIIAEGQGEVK